MKRKKIIHLRVERNLNQKEFGELLGVTSQYISLIEGGKANGSYKFWHKFKITFEIPDDQIEFYKKIYE